MYMKPYKERDKFATNNYKVAVKMTFPNATARTGIATVDVYYLGPNYNISVNNAGYYLAHEDFWKRLDAAKDIIQRKFQLGTYWISSKNITHPHEPKFSNVDFTLDGIAQKGNKNLTTTGGHYFLPWLKNPAW